MYLKECLDSVCSQNFNDLEIICVNDGSTDSSLDILEDYAKKDNRIKVITQKNSGLGHARNTGLNHATGDYILFVDSDDFLTDNSLDELYYNAISNDSDIVIFNFNNCNYCSSIIWTNKLQVRGIHRYWRIPDHVLEMDYYPTSCYRFR